MSVRIVWFRRDVRLADNLALHAALSSCESVLGFATLRTPYEGAHASHAWRAISLRALTAEVEQRGGRLLVADTEPVEALRELVMRTSARVVHCTRDWSPRGMREERACAETLATVGARLSVAEGQLLVPPDAIRAVDGRPYQVFTPFYRAWRAMIGRPALLSAPTTLSAPVPPSALPLTPMSDIGAEPTSLPGVAIEEHWTPGEAAAQARLAAFVETTLAAYEQTRDRLDVCGTSQLSPHLAHGEIAPARIMAALDGHPPAVTEPFVRQLAWREFAYHVVHHHPEAESRPLKPAFEAFPWADDEEMADAWRQGRTGFALVDAGMMQLALTGWMHNRARMVCASFLTKDLLVPWQAGEEHFRRMLVDYDPALNVVNWQWVAGCGADAAPFFRIFNPVVQQRRFDPDGRYVRRWLQAREPVTPIIDHAEARQRALAAYEAVRHRRSRTER